MLPCMAVKTITIDLEAYERLSGARVQANESFSKVIKRATWAESAMTGSAWAEGYRTFPAAGADVLDALEKNQALDQAPEDPWAS